MAHKHEHVSTKNGYKVLNSGTETTVINQNGTPGSSIMGAYPKFAANYTTTGGAAAEAITVTGALVTDIPFVMLQDGGTNTVTVASAAVTANTLTITFSADPGDDAVVSYALLRPTA